MIARVLGLIDPPPTRTTPTGESDILHPLLLIFDIRSTSVQRYIPPESCVVPRRAGFLAKVGPVGGNPLTGFGTRERRSAARELAIVSLAGVASFLFMNHQNLYLSGPFALSNAPLEAYFLATTVIYLFLRLVAIALAMSMPGARAELVRCPECGRWIDEATAGSREAHHRIELTPKPAPKALA